MRRDVVSIVINKIMLCKNCRFAKRKLISVSRVKHIAKYILCFLERNLAWKKLIIYKYIDAFDMLQAIIVENEVKNGFD